MLPIIYLFNTHTQTWIVFQTLKKLKKSIFDIILFLEEVSISQV